LVTFVDAQDLLFGRLLRRLPEQGLRGPRETLRNRAAPKL
jgi:hypothetical protein